MLIQWGLWQRGNASLDFPKISIIGRCIDDGPGASHSTVAGSPHMPIAVEAVEGCVLTMPKHLKRVCMHRYVGQEPDHVAARKNHIPLGIYQRRVNQAVNFLAKYLLEL